MYTALCKYKITEGCIIRLCYTVEINVCSASCAYIWPVAPQSTISSQSSGSHHPSRWRNYFDIGWLNFEISIAKNWYCSVRGSLSYSSNAERQARQWNVHIWNLFLWLFEGLKLRLESHHLCKWVAGSQLIWSIYAKYIFVDRGFTSHENIYGPMRT